MSAYIDRAVDLENDRDDWRDRALSAEAQLDVALDKVKEVEELRALEMAVREWTESRGTRTIEGYLLRWDAVDACLYKLAALRDK